MKTCKAASISGVNTNVQQKKNDDLLRIQYVTFKKGSYGQANWVCDTNAKN